MNVKEKSVHKWSQAFVCMYVKEIYPSHILNTVLRKMVELLPSFLLPFDI